MFLACFRDLQAVSIIYTWKWKLLKPSRCFFQKEPFPQPHDPIFYRPVFCQYHRKIVLLLSWCNMMYQVYFTLKKTDNEEIILLACNIKTRLNWSYLKSMSPPIPQISLIYNLGFTASWSKIYLFIKKCIFIK